MSNPIDDYELARDEYLKSKENEYSFEKNGRFGRTKDGKIVEILSYTKPEYSKEQELFYKETDNSLSFAYVSEFQEFDIHSSFLSDNPLKFGDVVQLRDIPASVFLNLEQHEQESYDLFLDKFGLITKVIEELQTVLVAFTRDVIEIPIHLIEKIYEREIW